MIEIGSPCPQSIVEEHIELCDYEKRPGISTFDVCNICGYAQWRETRETKDAEGNSTNGTKFLWTDSSKCPKCAEVWRRTPELFIWTVQVCKIALMGSKS